MFHVDWAAVATDDVLEALREIAGAGGQPTSAELRPLVATILTHAGGLPVAAGSWTAAERTAVARKLLHEAVGALLRRGYRRTRPLPGCDLSTAGDGGSLRLERKLVARPRIDVNTADAATLESLPVLGPALTSRLLTARRAGGPFTSAMELAERVNGIGEAGAERLGLMLQFDGGERPAEASPIGAFTGDLTADLALLTALHPGSSPADRLRATLEALATFCAATPHPATRAGRVRPDLHNDPAPFADLLPVDQVEVLESEAYYPRVRQLLNEAKARIDVAMFFIAFPSAMHPSGQLLNRLATAHESGAIVRVLVDRDREDDPYGSRIINADAIAFLQERGVPVRVDAEDRLLHSKFVAIDTQIAVVGSHNWTAGSYFQYRDTSVAIAAEALASALHARFDQLWAAGNEP